MAMLLQLKKAVKDALKMTTDDTENDVSVIKPLRKDNLMDADIIIDKKKTTETGKLDQALKAACKVTPTNPKVCQLGQGKNSSLVA